LDDWEKGTLKGGDEGVKNDTPRASSPIAPFQGAHCRYEKT
jgi:hypothetical protein